MCYTTQYVRNFVYLVFRLYRIFMFCLFVFFSSFFSQFRFVNLTNMALSHVYIYISLWPKVSDYQYFANKL